MHGDDSMLVPNLIHYVQTKDGGKPTASTQAEPNPHADRAGEQPVLGSN